MAYTDYERLCKYIYNIHHIPAFHYQNRKLKNVFPLSASCFELPVSYLHDLRSSSADFSYCETSLHSLYGYIRIPITDDDLLIGPMNTIRFSTDDLFMLHREYKLLNKDCDESDKFYLSLPSSNMEYFFQILTFTNYILTGKDEYLHQYLSPDSEKLSFAVNQSYYDSTYIFDQEQNYEKNYAVEEQITRYIELGKVQELDTYLRNLTYIPIHAKIANNNHRQLQNIFIMLITIAARSSIKGGLSPSYASKLADTYIYRIEQVSDSREITTYIFHALLDFAQNVAQNAVPLQTSTTNMSYVIEYVQRNLNQPLSVSSIAEIMGFSRSHLSRKFKQELGFDLSAFIMRCKLETGKELLTYSNKSILEISVYLCFSSQAHFQKAFKNQFGLTPLQYRNQTKK